MSVISWVRSMVSHRGKSVELYRSGMKKADLQDYKGAIADYSAAIESTHTPPDVKAMATYNRALAFSAILEHGKAAQDLSTVLHMPQVPPSVKDAALRRQERVRKRDQRK